MDIRVDSPSNEVFLFVGKKHMSARMSLKEVSKVKMYGGWQKFFSHMRYSMKTFEFIRKQHCDKCQSFQLRTEMPDEFRHLFAGADRKGQGSSALLPLR